MSAESIRRFTCDKCGRVVETASSDQPDRWSRLTITEPPLANQLDLAVVDMHLCDACTSEAYDLFIDEKERDRE